MIWIMFFLLEIQEADALALEDEESEEEEDEDVKPSNKIVRPNSYGAIEG